MTRILWLIIGAIGFIWQGPERALIHRRLHAWD